MPRMTPAEFDRAVIAKLVQGEQPTLSDRQANLVEDIAEYFERCSESYIERARAAAIEAIVGFCNSGFRLTIEKEPPCPE